MTYAVKVRARDTRGLDPKTYVVTVGVYRADGMPMTEAEAKRIEAALAGVAADDEATDEKRTGTGGE